MTHLKSVLAFNVKAHRKALGLTQEKLAEEVNTAPTYIAMIESGRRTPSFKMIERIAEILRIDPPGLFATKDYPSQSTSVLHEELMGKFDLFLRSALKELKEKG
jgi:transcriptional regulator with XRE-family HTH domain